MLVAAINLLSADFNLWASYELDLNKAALENSQYELADDYLADRSWAVAYFSGTVGQVGTSVQGGLIGTSWLLDETKLGQVKFVTADHIFRIAENKIDSLSNGKYLIHPKGISINLDRSVVERFPDKDIAIITIGPGTVVSYSPNSTECPALPALKLSSATTEKIITRVCNVGYPGREAHLMNKAFFPDINAMFIPSGPWSQCGIATIVGNINFDSNDAHLRHVDVIKLFYTSEVGFSGGPVIDLNDGKVIGFMSSVWPSEYFITPPTEAMVISSSEIIEKVR